MFLEIDFMDGCDLVGAVVRKMRNSYRIANAYYTKSIEKKNKRLIQFHLKKNRMIKHDSSPQKRKGKCLRIKNILFFN